jgi:hypothetical protein
VNPLLRWLRVHRAWGLPRPPSFAWLVRLERLVLFADDFAGPEPFYGVGGISWRSKVECLVVLMRRGDAYGCEKVLRATRATMGRAEEFLARDRKTKETIEASLRSNRAYLALAPNPPLRDAASQRGLAYQRSLVTLTERERRWREILAHRVREEQAFALVYRLVRQLCPHPIVNDGLPPKGK